MASAMQYLTNYLKKGWFASISAEEGGSYMVSTYDVEEPTKVLCEYRTNTEAVERALNGALKGYIVGCVPVLYEDEGYRFTVQYLPDYQVSSIDETVPLEDSDISSEENTNTITEGDNTMSTLFNSTLVDLIEEALVGSAAAEPTLGEELGLSQKQIRVEGFDLDLVPEELKRLFTFHSVACTDSETFSARSIAVSVFAARLGEDGEILPASPSIKNAPYGRTSKYGAQGGAYGDYSVIKPDLYIEADFYTDGEATISVPTVYKAPYTGKETESVNVSVLLSTANKTISNCFEYHDAARETFRRQLVFLSKEAGVPVGEQFLVCMVGFPAISGESHSRTDKDSKFWGVKFNGAYALGVRKVAVARHMMSEQLNSLRVRADMMVGGRSLKERMAAELTKAHNTKSTAVSKPVQKPAPAAVAPKPVQPPTPTPAPEVEKPKVTGMPSAGILSKLAEISKNQPSQEDDLTLIEEDANLNCSDSQEEEEVVVPVSRTNPFA
jgi:hypothetical protein